MAQYNDTTTLAGITKQVYGAKLEKLAFDMAIVRRLVPFEEGQKLGDLYHFPVLVAMEQGVTYNGTAGSVVSLQTPISATTQDAQIKGSEVIVRAQIAYKAIATAVEQGEKAFLNATRLMLENLSDSAQKRMELSLLYGTGGLGKVSANSSGTLTLTAATWTSGTWSDMENTILEAWDGTGATQTQHNGNLTITAVNFDNQTVTVSGTNSAVVANDWLYFKGARTSTAYNEMFGVSSIINNTGTLFNISASTYSRWLGNVTTLTSPNTAINMAVLLQNIRKMVNRGFKGKSVCLLPAQAYEVLNTDLAALRRFDGSYSRTKTEAGTEAIEFHTQAGTMQLEPHPLVRDGDTFVFPMEMVKRVGATDIRFGIPGSGDGEIFFPYPGNNAYEAQVYYDQAIIFERPSHSLLITGITYS